MLDFFYFLLLGPSFAEPHTRGRNFDSHCSLCATFRKERMQDASAPGAYLKHSFNFRETVAQKAHILRIGSLFHRADIPPALCGGFIILRSLYVFIGFVCEIFFHIFFGHCAGSTYAGSSTASARSAATASCGKGPCASACTALK